MKRQRSFSGRISLNVVLVTSILFIITIAAAAISSHLIIAREAERSAENLRDAALLKIENRLRSVELRVESAAMYISCNTIDKDKPYEITTTLLQQDTSLVGSAVAFREGYFRGIKYHSPYSWRDSGSGRISSKQLGNDDYDYFSMEWFASPASTGRAVWSEPYYDDGGGQYLMTTYSCPMFESGGAFIGVVTADLALDDITEFLAGIKPYPSSVVSLMTEKGKFISGGIEIPAGVKLMGSDTAADSLSGKMTYRVGRKMAFTVYSTLSNGWLLLLSCDYGEVLAQASIMHVILILLALVGLSVLFAICYLSISKLTRPIVEFSESAKLIASGNFNVQLPPYEYDDELGRLRGSFDYMQNSLTSYMDNLRSTTAVKERIQSELNIASGIQMSMLPTDFPKEENVDIYAFLRPAKEVGGDFYDYYIQDGVLYFTVGDVSGKGVSAAMFMAITLSAFRFISRMGLPVNEVAAKINNSISEENDTGMFVTMFVGRIDLQTGEFEYCNAGHNPILLDGEYLEAKPNLAVGLFPDFDYEVEKRTLSKGASLTIYTDGVSEAERADLSQYGDDRLREVVKRAMDSSSRELCDAVMNDVRLFAEGNDQNDDITIMNIKLK